MNFFSNIERTQITKLSKSQYKSIAFQSYIFHCSRDINLLSISNTRVPKKVLKPVLRIHESRRALPRSHLVIKSR